LERANAADDDKDEVKHPFLRKANTKDYLLTIHLMDRKPWDVDKKVGDSWNRFVKHLEDVEDDDGKKIFEGIAPKTIRERFAKYMELAKKWKADDIKKTGTDDDNPHGQIKANILFIHDMYQERLNSNNESAAAAAKKKDKDRAAAEMLRQQSLGLLKNMKSSPASSSEGSETNVARDGKTESASKKRPADATPLFLADQSKRLEMKATRLLERERRKVLMVEAEKEKEEKRLALERDKEAMRASEFQKVNEREEKKLTMDEKRLAFEQEKEEKRLLFEKEKEDLRRIAENEKEARQQQLHMEQLKMLAAMTASMTSVTSKMMDFMSDKKE
jgi:hypothetical protein